MRKTSQVLVVVGTLLLTGGLVASAMGVLHPVDRLMSRDEVRQVDLGTYTLEVYRCGVSSGVRHYVYYVERDGILGFSKGDQLIYIYDWKLD